MSERGDDAASRAILEAVKATQHNATKLNIAQWRWIRSGQRNPPVAAQIAHTAAIVWSKLHTFKIGHCEIQLRPLGVKTGQHPKTLVNQTNGPAAEIATNAHDTGALRAPLRFAG
jgi:hypothetical protein